MALPIAQYRGGNRPRKKLINQFGGLNENTVIPEGEFSDLINVNLDEFPIIKNSYNWKYMETDKANDRTRAVVFKNGRFKMFDNRFEFLPDGNGSKVIENVSFELGTQIVKMGAYLVFFPIRMAFNTETKKMQGLEAEVITSHQVTFEPTTRVAGKSSAFTKIISREIATEFRRYDSITISKCINEAFNTTKVISEIGSDYIIVPGLIDKSFVQPEGLRIKRRVPRMDFVCCHNNRLWGCSSENHEIYASRLGDPFNWNNFEGIASDSYVATIASDGAFTACTSYQGNVYFFKENIIHKVFGDKPQNFMIKEYEQKGVAKGAYKTLTNLKDNLCYKGVEGVYLYDGITPKLITKNIKNYKFEDVAITHKDKYYIGVYSGSDETKNKERFAGVYYPELGAWCIEDMQLDVCYVNPDDELFAYGKNRMLKKLDIKMEDTDINALGKTPFPIVEWKLQSGDLLEGTLNEKYLARIAFQFLVGRGTVINIFVRYDDELKWERVGTVYGRGRKVVSIPIALRRNFKTQFKLEGKNEFKLISIEKYIQEGSELGVRI